MMIAAHTTSRHTTSTTTIIGAVMNIIVVSNSVVTITDVMVTVVGCDVSAMTVFGCFVVEIVYCVELAVFILAVMIFELVDTLLYELVAVIVVVMLFAVPMDSMLFPVVHKHNKMLLLVCANNGIIMVLKVGCRLYSTSHTDSTSSCVLATLQCENKECSAVISS